MTKTVRDAAYLLSKMAGRSDKDEGTWGIPFNGIPDFTTYYQGTDLTGITVGVPRNTFSTDPTSPVMVSFESAIETLRRAGAKVVDSADFPKADGFKELKQEVLGTVCSSEFKRDIGRYLQTLDTNPNNIQSVDDIIAFTKTFPA